jgi:hypothetical protein
MSARDERALGMFVALRERGRVEESKQRGVQFCARVSVAALGREELLGDGRAVDAWRKAILLVVDESEPLRVFVERVSIGKL